MAGAIDTIVKIGGSVLSDTDRLKQLLGVVANAESRVGVVPGGGPFANAVREAYHRFGIDQSCAHDMAVLAVSQTGLLFQALSPGLRVCEDREELACVFAGRKNAIVLPRAFLRDAGDLPRDWTATSDTLAAVLARDLGARRIVFVKSCRVDRGETIAALQARGVLDAAVGGFVEQCPADVHVIGPDRDCEFLSLINREGAPAHHGQ